MNFLLLRSNQQGAPEPPPVPEEVAESTYVSNSAITLEGFIAEDPFPEYPTVENHDGQTNGFLGKNAGVASDKIASVHDNHIDVSEEDGWITIPYKVLPDDWNHAPDIRSLHSLDRSFVFPGEQVHILACLSACNQETEIITPFKVAAVMSKNGMRKGAEKQNGNMEGETNSVPVRGEVSPNGAVMDQNSENLEIDKTDPAKDVSSSESFLRMEDHRRQTEMLLKRFKNSHFFVRIAESGEPLWSKKGASQTAPESSELDTHRAVANESKNTAKNISRQHAVIDRGNFDANVSGGVARDGVKCCSLSNGDIVVLLQVNVGVDFLRDPVIEILQFEKYQDRNLSSENQDNFVYANQDPCGELLKWLLPLDNTLPPPHTLSPPPPLGSGSGISSTSQRSAFSASSGSQLFSFSHFRSYSMSSLPQNVATPPGPVKAQSSKPSFDLDEVDHSSSQKNFKSQRTGTGELLSFRGVSLERERFSVCCGLEGIHIPGRRWRRKLQIIQPIEIHSNAADCNTDNLLCVQIKNVSPAHLPDIVVYIDAITVVLEEASKGGPPASLPIACIEAGEDHSLPNLALRRGEEHSFILKPASSMWRDLKTYGEQSKSSSLQPPSKTFDRKGSASIVNHYAVMVSCRCNHTESRLFFKQSTSWRPRIPRDLMISVASEMSGQYSGPNEGVTQLPVQVLTLQASNLTPEDLTMTVLAPASFTSPPSVVSLNSSPTSPMSPFVGFSELAGKASSERCSSAVYRLSSMPTISENQKQNGDAGARFTSLDEHLTSIADFIPTSGLGCTHLWLQSRVPLGCVPAQSTATVKLELLPLTDGIITLDTLHIDVKEKDNKSANDTSRDQPAAAVVSSTTTSNTESNSSTSKLEDELKVASRLRKFTFNDLKLATRNFRPESLLGEGGFGCVFKGWIEENGTAPVKPGTGLTVAVKTLNHDGLQGHKEWLAEVNFLGDLIHPNLVKLVGYCIEDDQRLLVYEFMPRGSLENHLFRRSLPLPWSIRMKIALGAAKGLAFLHEEAERPVIYRDFKTSNILLDADYNAKLSDFGLAKDGPEGDKTHVSTRVMGTYGYAAPEYVMTGHLTSRSDVYSFGVVLLEMLTGRRSMDKNRPNGEHNLVEWARPYLRERRRFYRLIDPRLEGHFSIKGAQKAAQMAAHCLSRDPKARPLMSEVVEALKPLPNLKDMASSSYYFQTMQAERVGSSPNARNGIRTQAGLLSRNGHRSLSIPNGSHASPYHHQYPYQSPKPNGKP